MSATHLFCICGIPKVDAGRIRLWASFYHGRLLALDDYLDSYTSAEAVEVNALRGLAEHPIQQLLASIDAVPGPVLIVRSYAEQDIHQQSALAGHVRYQRSYGFTASRVASLAWQIL